MIYSHKLRELRDKRGLSNHELAELSHVPESTLCRILSGQTDNPGFGTICDIVEALGGDMNDIVGKAAQTPASNDTGVKEPAQTYSERIAVLEKRVELMERSMYDKNKWLMRMFIYSCITTIIALVFACVEFSV